MISSSSLSSQSRRFVFATIVLICTCLLLVPMYTVWEARSFRPQLLATNSFEALTLSDSNSSQSATDVVITDNNQIQKENTTASLSPSSTSEWPTTSPVPLTNRSYHGHLDHISDSISANTDRFPPPSRLINITDFEYLRNPVICRPQDEVFMLVMVGSNPVNVFVRQAIRQTWGNPNITGYPFKLVFMFGMFKDPVVQAAMETEIEMHGDIVQGNFIDSYHNVTARDMMAMRWAWNYCPQARYVMRADDDISVNVFILKDILEKRFGDYEQKNMSLLACYAQFIQTRVLREGNYAVSRVEHPADIYDPYCSGWMYVVNTRMAMRLDKAGLQVRPYWMNDAYITGSLSKALSVPIQDLKIPYTFNYDEMVSMDGPETIPARFILGYVGNNITLIENLHRKYKRQYIFVRMSQNRLWTIN